MKASLWYEGVTGRGEIIFWLLVMSGIYAYSWWSHHDWYMTMILVAVVASFLEFNLSTRQIARLMCRTKELEDQVYALKKLQDRVRDLEARTISPAVR
jgi:hypothetical protein